MKGSSRTGSRRGGVRPPGVFVRRLSRSLAFVAGVLWGLVVYYTPSLSVARVDVIGTEALQPGEIRTALALEGRRLLSLDVSAARAEVAKRPWVKSVEVRRRLPDTVLVQVHERKAVAVWRSGNQDFLVDADGVVLDRSKNTSALPSIFDINGAVLVPGDAVDNQAVTLAVSLSMAIPEKLGAEVKHFEYASDGLAAITESGQRAAFGTGERLGFKLAVWQALEPHIAETCPNTYQVDLRFGYNPYFRCI